MTDVLASPTTRRFTDRRYARAYYLFKHMNATDLNIKVQVGEVQSGESALPDNVQLHPVGGNGKAQYLVNAYRSILSHLDDIDVYHHPNFNFREFNPLAIVGQLDDVPFLVGPAEGGHLIPRPEFKDVLNRSVGFDVPDSLLEVIYQFVHPLKGKVVDPSRETLFERTLSRADRIVAVHSDAANKYAEFVEREKIQTIPYGVALNEFTFTPRPKSKSLLTIGNLIHRKGHKHLLKAMCSVQSAVPDAHLHIVGSGPLRQELESYAHELGVMNCVTFHGFVERKSIREFLESARAFVHPSLSEGFSHVRLEAMATGCPVVGTNVDGAHDLTRDGVDGYIVPTADPDALAEATIDLLTNLEKARKMGRNAREKVEQDHDWGDIAAQYADIYHELAE